MMRGAYRPPCFGGASPNLNYQWKQVFLPKGLVVAHALVAVVGFVLLLIVALR